MKYIKILVFNYQYHINSQYQFLLSSFLSSNFETGIRAASNRDSNLTNGGPDEDDKKITKKIRHMIDHEADLCKFRNLGFRDPEELLEVLRDVTSDANPAEEERAKTVIKQKLQDIQPDAFVPEVTLDSVKRFSEILGEKLKTSFDTYNLIVDADNEYYKGMHFFRIFLLTPKFFFLISNEEECCCLLEH